VELAQLVGLNEKNVFHFIENFCSDQDDVEFNVGWIKQRVSTFAGFWWIRYRFIHPTNI
jgi:hypothetical protein